MSSPSLLADGRTRVCSVLFKVWNPSNPWWNASRFGQADSRLGRSVGCLTKNNYNEAKCQDLVDALYECCDAFYRKNGDGATSASCPKASLLRLKMKQRSEGTK